MTDVTLVKVEHNRRSQVLTGSIQGTRHRLLISCKPSPNVIPPPTQTNTSESFHLARSHVEPRVVDLGIRSIGSCRNNQLSSPRMTDILRKHQKVKRRDKETASPEPSYLTIWWLWMSLQIQYKIHFTQREISMNTPLFGNELRQ